MIFLIKINIKINKYLYFTFKKLIYQFISTFLILFLLILYNQNFLIRQNILS